jgi:broad specificity phosphatase PhoE
VNVAENTPRTPFRVAESESTKARATTDAMRTKRTVILVRHGETDWNKAGRFQGQSDIPLNDFGRAQARDLRVRLKATPSLAPLFEDARTAVVTSDLARAHETASIAFGVAGRTLHVDPALREFCYGIFEGLTGDEIEFRYPGKMAMWRSSHRHFAIDGGESRAAVHERVHAAVTFALERLAHENLVVIAHGGVIRQLLYTCFGDERVQAEQGLSYANAATHVVRVDGATWNYDCEL